MTIDLAKELIRRVSVTPADAGCQQLIAERLSRAGFIATHLPCNQVENIWLQHGDGQPVFTLLGHTDVVPAGPLAASRSRTTWVREKVFDLFWSSFSV